MTFSEMFRDDATGQLSLARVMVGVLCLYYIIAFYGKDIPINLAGLITCLYWGNKAASTTAIVKGANNVPAQ